MLAPKELLIRAAAILDHCKAIGLDEMDTLASLDAAMRSQNHSIQRKGMFLPSPPPAAPPAQPTPEDKPQ